MTELHTDGKSIKPLTTLAQAIKRDELAMSSLTSLINNPEFVEGNSEGDSGKFSRPPSDPLPNAAELKHTTIPPTPVAPVPPPEPEPEQPINFESRICTTGRLNAGKDTFLNSLGRTIHGFADPLYAIQKAFFGTDDKKAPGARVFLQKVGQWGRGMVSAQYPLTTERAVFITLMQALGQTLGFSVDWAQFGKTDTLWVDALLARTADLDNIGVSNVRFKNERESLTAAGFVHYHVMASPNTLQRRWAAAGIAPNDPVLNDGSEQMAIALDKAALEAGRKPGGKLRVIWSDKQVKSPSPRFITL